MKEKKVSDKVEKRITSKNEPIILWRDEAAISELKSKLDALMPFTERLIQSYHKLPFSEESTLFYDVLANTTAKAQSHLKNTLPDKMDIAGVTLNKAKVLQLGLIEVDGMVEFNKALDEFTTAGGMNYHTYFKHVEKAVIIDSIVFSKFEALNTIAAITPEEIELFNKWQNFLTNINEFATFIKKYNLNILPVALGPLIIIQIARLDKENKLIINKDAFQMLAKRLRNKIN